MDEFDRPGYIRKKVHSCSDFTELSRKDNLHPFEKLEFDKFPKGIDLEMNSPIDIERTNSFLKSELRTFSIRKTRIDNNSETGDFEGSLPSSQNSVEEWNEEEDVFSMKDNQTSHSFSSRFYSTPKTLSATFTRLVNNLFENPDGRMTNTQRVAIIILTAFEAYRTLISSFLTVFVPQNCGGYSCTIIQNIVPKDDLEIAAISVNTFMAVYFCWLFTIERVRETLVKKYLIADKSSATDKDYLIKMLSEMKPHQRQRILRINRVYRIFAQVLLIVFFINAGISCVVIQKNYLNNTTITVFITNTFFMINRIHKALKVTSSGEYNIYSAYRSDNLLYNRYRGEIAKNYASPVRNIFTEN